MTKIINFIVKLYKNSYFKFLVFIIFLFYLIRNYYGHKLPSIKELHETRTIFNVTKKIKTVMSQIKDGHASYTKQIVYEYDSNTDNNKTSLTKNLQNRLDNRVAKLDYEIKKQAAIIETQKEKIHFEETQTYENQINDFIKEYEINTDTQKNKIKIKCGDTAQYNLATYINGQPMSLNVFNSKIIIGVNINKKLEQKFIKKQIGNVFEVDFETFLGEQIHEFKKIREKFMQENNIKDTIDYDYSFKNLNLTYRIKITKIIRGDANIIKQYCTNAK
jgi:hypothetical protein